MTLLYAIVFTIANYVGGHETFELNPVNGWALALLICLGLDLAGSNRD